MKEMEAELNVVRAAYATTEKEEGEFKSKEIDIKHELSKFDTVVKENHGKLKHWQKEVRTFYRISLIKNRALY